MNHLAPEISVWYRDLVSGSVFEVVAVDENSRTIEYQLIDGEVGEYDLGTWRQLNLLSVEPPEDWRSPFEINREDYDYNEQSLTPMNWSDPLSEIEADLTDYGDDFQVFQ